MPKCRVLLADDFEPDILTYQTYLEDEPDYDYECFSASSGKATIDAYLELKPDCLVLDYSFSDMTGLEVLQKLQELTGYMELPVLIISGSGSQKIALQALRLGAQDYSIKCDVSSNGLSVLIQNTILKTQLAKEVKAQKQEIIAKNLELEQTNFELGMFAHTACNELNRPLSLMMAFFECLQPKLKPEDQKTLGLLKSTGRSMHSYVSGLLDWSKVRYTKATFEEIDVTLLAKEVIQELTAHKYYFRPFRNIKVTGEGMIEGDKEQIRHLIKQLILSSSLHKGDDLQAVLEISHDPDSKQNHLTISVHFENETQQNHSADFFSERESNNSFSFHASRIGRTICQIILDEHKGKLHQAQGTSEAISVILPAKR